MAHIQFTPHKIRFQPKDKKRLETWIERIVLSHQKFPDTISYIFCSDTYLAEINKSYLRHNTLTDIITFNYNSGHYVAGDIFISIDRLKENAATYSVSFDNELHRVMVHGVLHLLGFNDKSAAQLKKMRKAEDEALAILANM